MNWRAGVVGAIAGAGYLFMASRFACCHGEDGFSANVSDGLSVAAALLVTALAVQPAWRTRALLSIAAAAVLFVMLCIIVLVARPAWDDYIRGRPLQVGVRTAAVFVAATLAAFIELRFMAYTHRRRIQ